MIDARRIKSVLRDRLWVAICRPEARFVMLIVVVGTLLLAVGLARVCRRLDERRLQRDARLLAALIKERFDSHRDGLVSLGKSLESKADLHWIGFSNQVEMLYPALNYPAFTEFSYAPRVFDQHRSAFESRAMAMAGRPIPIRFPDGRSNEWISFPIFFHQFTHPHWALVDDIFTLWGLDLNQDDREREWMRWAWGAGRPATTAAGPSVWGPGDSGRIRLYLPVFDPDQQDWTSRSNATFMGSPRLIQDPGFRREAVRAEVNLVRLRGLLCATIDVPRLVARAFPSNALPLALAIDDAPAGTNIHRMFGAVPAGSYLQTEFVEHYFGRDWRFQFATTRLWEASSLRYWPLVELGVGGLLSVAAAAIVGMGVEGRARDREARQNSEAQQHELERARDDLRTAVEARQQLNRNLHDSVLQRLYAVILQTREVRDTVAHGWVPAVGRVDRQISELDSVMNDIRGFLSGGGVHGISGADLGLALRGVSATFSRQGGVVVEVVASTEALNAVPPECGEHFLQIVREGVSNAWRHGKARRVSVVLGIEEERVILRLEDNGRGFNPESTSHRGQGLRNLRERAALCGGVMEVESRAGGPTRLTFRLPKSGTSAPPPSIS